MKRCLLVLFVLLSPLALFAPRAEAKPARYWAHIKEGVRDDKEYANVKAVQLLLRARGYRIGVDGVFGPQTTNQIRAFQKSRRLIVNGVMTDPTWEALVIRVKRGSKGDAVRAVQHLLRASGYDVPVTGSFAQITEAAVRKFQAQQGRTVDGIVGPFTWNSLVTNMAG